MVLSTQRWTLQWRHLNLMASQTPSTRLLGSTALVRRQHIEHKKSPVRGTTGDTMASAHKGPVTRKAFSDSNFHGANMWPTWGQQDPGGPHVGHVNLAIWVSMCRGVILGYFDPILVIISTCSQIDAPLWIMNEVVYRCFRCNCSRSGDA